MTGKVTKWIVTADKVQRLQVNRRVTDCLYDEGWQTFVGMDFGGNDDFMAISTLSVNYAEGLEMKDRFFWTGKRSISPARWNPRLPV